MLSLFIATAGLNTSAQDATPVEDLGPVTVEKPRESTWSDWVVDPVTFEVIGPPEAVLLVMELNSPEKIEERRLVTLSATDPEEYARLFPKTEEQLRAEEESLNAIRNPITIEERAARQTPEQNVADEEEFFLIANGLARPETVADVPPFTGTPIPLEPSAQDATPE